MRLNESAFRYFILIFCLLIFTASASQAQTTAFNFQGRLNDGGNAANSNYDFQFKLFDALTGGTIFGSVDRPNLQVINGVFSTTLDFGAAFGGGDRFLEILVRPAGSPNAHVVLGARQQILAVPFAAASTNSSNASNALALGGISATSYARLNFNNQGDVVGANVGSNGYISVQGNALQPAASNGFPKMMLAVTATGAIARCYNGVTGVSSGNCGVSIQNATGDYTITFPFPVANRFWLVTNHTDTTTAASDVLSIRIIPLTNANQLVVTTQLNGTKQNLPFHMFVF